MMTHAFKPSVDLTFDTAMAQLDKLRTYLNAHQQDVCHLDLSDVKTCDSAGLALLIEAKRLSLQQRQTLVIEGMSQAVMSLAAFCGVDELLFKQ